MENITAPQAQYLTNLIAGLRNPSDPNSGKFMRADITATLRTTAEYRALRATAAKHRPTMGRDENGKVVFAYSAEGESAKKAVKDADAAIALEVEQIMEARVARYAELKALDIDSLTKAEASDLITELKN